MLNLYRQVLVAVESRGQMAKYCLLAIAILFNGLVYVVFLLLVLLFELLPGQSKEHSCFHRGEKTTSWHAQFVLSIVYRVFVAVIALGLGVGFLVFGGKIWAMVYSCPKQLPT